MLISLKSCSLAKIHGLSVLFLAILLGVKSIGSYPPSNGMSIRRRLRMCATSLMPPDACRIPMKWAISVDFQVAKVHKWVGVGRASCWNSSRRACHLSAQP